MKSLWNNFKVAFAMFSKIPMPRADWTKENMKYMFCFFPAKEVPTRLESVTSNGTQVVCF